MVDFDKKICFFVFICLSKFYIYSIIYLANNVYGGLDLTVDTNNYYGNISISDNAIRTVAGFVALDCYGVVDLVAKNFKDSAREVFKHERYSKGVSINHIDNRIFIDIHCILKYGVSISAVAESLKKSVKYNVENFTGMIVDTVNVHVVGVCV